MYPSTNVSVLIKYIIYKSLAHLLSFHFHIPLARQLNAIYRYLFILFPKITFT